MGDPVLGPFGNSLDELSGRFILELAGDTRDGSPQKLSANVLGNPKSTM
jgi:hypothetical protein